MDTVTTAHFLYFLLMVIHDALVLVLVQFLMRHTKSHDQRNHIIFNGALLHQCDSVTIVGTVPELLWCDFSVI